MDPEGLKTYESFVSGFAHTDYKFIKVLLKEIIDQKKHRTFFISFIVLHASQRRIIVLVLSQKSVSFLLAQKMSQF
jgi:hypothetical protein